MRHGFLFLQDIPVCAGETVPLTSDTVWNQLASRKGLESALTGVPYTVRANIHFCVSDDVRRRCLTDRVSTGKPYS